jgi:hypothetical protein
LTNHINGSTNRGTSRHDVIENEHALPGYWYANQAPTLAVILGFFAIVRKSNVNLMLRV